jgi:uncharacterized protein (TIGR00369 family)
MSTDQKKFIEVFKSINRFDESNGLTFEIHSPGQVTYHMTILEQHLSSPETAHGASLAGFMDCVLGLTSLSLSITTDQLVSTVEFKVNFVRPVKRGEKIIGTGKVIHQGKSLIISSAEVKNEAGDLVATGLGTFNCYPISKKGYLNDVPQ